MKKFLALMLVLVMSLSFVACGGGETAGDDETGEEKHSLIYFAIILGDLSFGDAGYNGSKAACDKYGWDFKSVELGNDTATYENAIADALDSGEYDILVTQNGYGLGDIAKKYAAEYPDVKFIIFDAGRDMDLSALDNAVGISFKTNEGAYLAGVLAARLSKDGKVGAFIFNDVPGGNDVVTGYVAGMQAADPDAKLYLAYGGGTAGPDVAYEVVNAMVGAGCNVLLGFSGRAFSGMVQALTEAGGAAEGYWAFGPDTDMYASYSQGENKQYADVIITSVLKNIENAVVLACDQYMDGSIAWGTVNNVGLLEDGAGLALNDYFKAQCPDEVEAELDDIIAKVKSGEMVIPSYYDFADYDEFKAWLDGTGVVASY